MMSASIEPACACHRLQSSLRRHARRTGSEHPAGGSRGGTSTPHRQDVEVGPTRPGHDQAARRPKSITKRIDAVADVNNEVRFDPRPSPGSRTSCRSSARSTTVPPRTSPPSSRGRATARSRARSPTRSWSSVRRAAGAVRRARSRSGRGRPHPHGGADRAEADRGDGHGAGARRSGPASSRQLMVDEADDDVLSDGTPLTAMPAFRMPRSSTAVAFFSLMRCSPSRGRCSWSASGSEGQEGGDLGKALSTRDAEIFSFFLSFVVIGYFCARAPRLFAVSRRSTCASCRSTCCTSRRSPSRPSHRDRRRLRRGRAGGGGALRRHARRGELLEAALLWHAQREGLLGSGMRDGLFARGNMAASLRRCWSWHLDPDRVLRGRRGACSRGS